MAEATDSAHKRLGKAADVLLGDIEAEIATTPYDVVFEVDRVKLKHYRPVTEKKIKTPIWLYMP